jgi:adenylate cyclase
MLRRDLDAALRALARAEFVYQLAAYPEVEYAFKHPLTQQVAYETQLREPRRRVHAKIARLLERRHADKLDEKAGLIAYHWQEAGEKAEAARWNARAAAWLESRNVTEALRHWRLTRSLLGAGAPSPESGELAMLACLHILSMGWRHGMSEDEAVSVLAEGTELARARGDTRTHIALLDGFAVYLGTGGRVHENLDYNRQALELAQALQDPDLTMELSGQRMHPLWAAGRPREALALASRWGSRALEPRFRGVRTSDGFLLSAMFKLLEGVNLVCVGRFDEARACLEESLALARQHTDADYESFAQHWLAECCVELGDLDAADRYARAGVQAAEKQNSQYAGVWAYRFLGRVLLVEDRPLDARAALERALANARESGTGLHGEADFLQLLAEAHLDIGEPERAQQACAEAIAVAQRNGTPLFECDAQLVQARILLGAGAPQADAARDVAAALDRAEALIAQIGAESRRPRLLELRAELAHAQGDAPARERFLREAQRVLTELGATVRAERFAQELAE